MNAEFPDQSASDHCLRRVDPIFGLKTPIPVKEKWNATLETAQRKRASAQPKKRSDTSRNHTQASDLPCRADYLR
jgi:hypothetical protein